MPITLKKDVWKVKDPSSGQYRGAAILSTTLPQDAAQIISESNATIQNIKDTAIDAVDTALNDESTGLIPKAEADRDAIDDSLNNATNGIIPTAQSDRDDVDDSLNNINNGIIPTAQANLATIAAAVQSQIGQGTDKTLSVAKGFADAKAAGMMVKVSNYQPGSALDDPATSQDSSQNTGYPVYKDSNRVWVKETYAELEVPTMDDHNELKSALNGSISLLNDASFVDNESLTIRATDANYRLKSDGKRESASGYEIVKYQVAAGDIIHINTTELSQFQSNTGWIDGNNIVGHQIDGEIIVKVPDTAITLCMCRVSESDNVSVKAKAIAPDLVNTIYKEKQSVYATTRPDDKLTWPIMGYYRVSDNRFIESNTYYISCPILLKPGEHVYCYGFATSSYYAVLAYDIKGDFLPEQSMVGTSTGIKPYALEYTYSDNVAFIRLSTAIAWIAISEVISKPLYNNTDAVARLIYYGDESALKFFVGFNYSATYRRLVPGSSGNTATVYGLIPTKNIYSMSIENTENYTMAIYFFDENYQQIGSLQRNLVFYLHFPTNTVFCNIAIRSVDTSATVDISQTGLKILSRACSEDQKEIEAFEMMRPANWDKTYFLNSHCISLPGTELMAHVSNIYDGEDGYLYIPYYANHSDYTEGIGSDITTKVAKVNLADLSKNVQEIASKNTNFGNFIQSANMAPYDPLFIKKNSNVFSYVFISTPTTTEKPCVAHADLNKSTLTIGDASLSTFKYEIDGTTYTVPMDIDNLSIFIDRLLGTTIGTHTIGIYPILTRACEHNGEWYSYLGGLQSTSADNGFGGCLVKTADYGATWEFVAYNAQLSNVTCMWEGAVDISSDSIAYCELKTVFKDPEIGSGYYPCDMAMYYNLTSNTWSDVIRINGSKNGIGLDSYLADTGNFSFYVGGKSRPFVYVAHDAVYMMHNVDPQLSTVWKPNGVVRSTLRILKFDYELNLIGSRTLQSDAGISYFSCINEKGREWFCYTEDRRHMQNDCKGQISIIPMTDRFLP